MDRMGQDEGTGKWPGPADSCIIWPVRRTVEDRPPFHSRNCQLSAISYQLSTVSDQVPAIGKTGRSGRTVARYRDGCLPIKPLILSIEAISLCSIIRSSNRKARRFFSPARRGLDWASPSVHGRVRCRSCHNSPVGRAWSVSRTPFERGPADPSPLKKAQRDPRPLTRR